MNAISAIILSQFLNDMDSFMLIIVRILTFFIVIPVLSGSSIPNTARITLTLAVTFLIYTSGAFVMPDYAPTIPGYLYLIFQEFMVGLMLSFVIFMLFNVFYFVGQLVDFQIGFSMVSVFDPLTQIQVPIIGNVLYFMMAVMFVISGAMHVFLSALFLSYEKIPIGSAFILGNDGLMLYMVGKLTDFFIIGLKMSMPIVGAIIVIDVALGILVKAVPQMNVFVVGMPIKLLAGLVLLYLTMPVFIQMFDAVFDMSYIALDNVMEAMSP